MDIDLDNAGAALQQSAEGGAGGAALSMPVLQLITDARNEHGMRQLDYTRYRHFCTIKVHRLRQSLKITHNDGVSKPADSTKGKRKGGAKAKGKRKATVQATLPPNRYTPKVIKASEIVNNRPAQLLLFEAERAWAHSQDLRDQSFKAENDPVIRRQGLARAARAVEWSTKLRDLSEALSEQLDASSALQVLLYALLIRGSASFDKNSFEPALENLSVARALLGQLTIHASSSRDEALANSFIDASDAQLRYCAYQLGLTEQDMDKVAVQTATEEVKQRRAPGYQTLIERLAMESTAKGTRKDSKEKVELEWRERKIPIRNADLMDAVVRVRTEEATLESQLAVADSKVGGEAAPQKKEQVKRQRLTHAERNAKKRGGATQASAAVKATAKAGGSARASLDPYDRVLVALTDAEELASSLVDDDAEALAKAHSGRFAAATADLRAAHEWLAFRLHALRVRRNERLVGIVRRKGERREARAKEALERRLRDAEKGGAAPLAGSGKAKKGADGQPVVKKAPRKPQTGSRAKRTRTKPTTRVRKPGRSGSLALRRKMATQRAERQRSLAADKVARRSVRAVPGLARLLDGAEVSVSALAALGLVEADPDVQSLLDAKVAWYRAEVCIVLSRAYGLSSVLSREGAESSANANANAKTSTARGLSKGQAEADAAARRIPPLAHSIVLLDRAALYVRQARQALELAEGVETIDAQLPPHLSTPDALTRTDAEIRTAKQSAQRTLTRAHASARRSELRLAPDDDGLPPNSKLTTALRDLANKYVEWDTRALESAQVVQGGLAQEVAGDEEEAAEAEEEVFDDAPSADVEAEETEEAEQFYDDEEEDDVGEQGLKAGQVAEGEKKGWLGGWFGRG